MAETRRKLRQVALILWAPSHPEAQLVRGVVEPLFQGADSKGAIPLA